MSGSFNQQDQAMLEEQRERAQYAITQAPPFLSAEVLERCHPAFREEYESQYWQMMEPWNKEY